MQFNLTLFKCLTLTLFFCDFNDSSHQIFGGKLFQTQNVISLLLGQVSKSVLRFLCNEHLLIFVKLKYYTIFLFEILLYNQAFPSLLCDFPVPFPVVPDLFLHLINFSLCLI